MPSTQSTTRHAGHTQDHDREPERTLRDAVVLLIGKRAGDQALRHARSKARGGWQLRRLVQASRHLAGFDTLLASIGYQRRSQQRSAGLSTKPSTGRGSDA